MTVLFDLDGTLVDSRAVALEAARCSLEEFFACRGVAPELPSEERILDLLGRPAQDYYRQLLPPRFQNEAAEAARLADRHEQRLFREGRIRPFPCIESLLEGLVSGGDRIGIATSGGPSYLSSCLGGAGLGRWVHAAVCRSDGADKAAQLQRLLRQLGGPAVAVGDRLRDIQAGKAAGLFTIGCLWGYGTPAELGAADSVAASVQELSLALDRYRARGRLFTDG